MNGVKVSECRKNKQKDGMRILSILHGLIDVYSGLAERVDDQVYLLIHAESILPGLTDLVIVMLTDE